MTVVDDTAAAVPAAPAPPIPQQPARAPRTAGNPFGAVLRLVLLVALAALLLYYVGWREMGRTALEVALVVVASLALWIGANRLFDQAHEHWVRFNALLGAVIGFALAWVLEANGLLRELYDKKVRITGQGVLDDILGWNTRPFDVNGLIWAALAAAALGTVLGGLTAVSDQRARLLASIVAFGLLGFGASLALEESAWPAFDWPRLWICVVVGAVLFGVVGTLRRGRVTAPLAALSGVVAGWLVGAWGTGDIGEGNRTAVQLATIVPAVLLGARYGLTPTPTGTKRRRIERRSRSWIFVVPALAFVVGGLLIPLVRTIYLSFRNRNGAELVGMDNYADIFSNDNSLNVSGWADIFTSRLFWFGLVVLGFGFLSGVVAGRRTAQTFERGPGSSVPMLAGLFVLACAVFSVLRGTIMNNLWWVVVVVGLSTAIGLAVAVLADRSKGEDGAKSLIFLPMAISFIGAGIIWRFMYQARDASQEQTGVLNAIWVWIGDVSNDTTSRAIAVAVLAVGALGLAALLKRSIDRRATTTVVAAGGLLVMVAYLIYRLLGPGLGGFIESNGVVRGDPVLFIQEAPFNNMWMMVVLIWIQTGFAMVILSAAIKAVPTELIEAAKMDGASESQVFWRITLPQIAPTLGVVVTTLIVTVMKVFDIVYAMTNGNFGTQVIANEMFQRAFGQSNFGLGSALAVVLFVSVLPVMYVNIRRIQKERV